MKRLYILLLGCFFCSFSACQSANQAKIESNVHGHTNSVEEVTAGYYQVVKVIDGDTFWVADDTKRFKVRFIGIDAPETRNSRWKQKGALAQEAKKFVQELTDKKTIRLELDVQKKDRYQRVLAYVYLADGRLLNAELLKHGYAVVDTYPPNVKYVEKFIELQQIAKAARVGVWKE